MHARGWAVVGRLAPMAHTLCDGEGNLVEGGAIRWLALMACAARTPMKGVQGWARMHGQWPAVSETAFLLYKLWSLCSLVINQFDNVYYAFYSAENAFARKFHNMQ